MKYWPSSCGFNKLVIKAKMHANTYFFEIFFVVLKYNMIFFLFFERLGRMHENKIFYYFFTKTRYFNTEFFRLSSPKNTTTYQRSTHNSKPLMHNKERSLNNSKRLKHNKERSLNNKKWLMNSFAKWSWTWQHRVEHVRLILFGRITTSLLLLQLHLYINL